MPFSCLVTPKDRKNRELFWRINQKRVDFVVLDENLNTLEDWLFEKYAPKGCSDNSLA